jgi:hypothetical protein
VSLKNAELLPKNKRRVRKIRAIMKFHVCWQRFAAAVPMISVGGFYVSPAVYILMLFVSVLFAGVRCAPMSSFRSYMLQQIERSRFTQMYSIVR